MKRILGLDLGSSSIGWAIIEEIVKKLSMKTNHHRMIRLLH